MKLINKYCLHNYSNNRGENRGLWRSSESDTTSTSLIPIHSMQVKSLHWQSERVLYQTGTICYVSIPEEHLLENQCTSVHLTC